MDIRDNYIRSSGTKGDCIRGTYTRDTYISNTYDVGTYIRYTGIEGTYNINIYIIHTCIGCINAVKHIEIYLQSSQILELRLFGTGLETIIRIG